jgi:hypothetical protein
MKIVALLESMWGWRGYHAADEEAPRFYRINPENFSGRRLYRICPPHTDLIVTNSCRIIQRSANHHGTPEPAYVLENLKQARQDGCDLFLICGVVAQDTFKRALAVHERHLFQHLFMDHPAARRWTNEKLDKVKAEIYAASSPTAATEIRS